MSVLTEERLFEPFIDATDGVLCLPAGSDEAEIERLAGLHGLRFPLLHDRGAPLCDQVAASPFAPASSRFGPYCDNITGMNWELPDGRRVRIGERVVKSTTGYDLLRFLLGTVGRYGRPVDYVLRLRPACEESQTFFLRGDPVLLRGGGQASRIVQSCPGAGPDSAEPRAFTSSVLLSRSTRGSRINGRLRASTLPPEKAVRPPGRPSHGLPHGGDVPRN